MSVNRSVPTQSHTLKFQSLDELCNWLSHYYLHPDKDLACIAFDFLSGDATILNADKSSWFVGFYSQIFADEPRTAQTVFATASGLDDDKFFTVVLAALYSGNTELAELIRFAVSTRPSLKATIGDTDLRPVLLTTVDPSNNSALLDQYWGAFSATGRAEFVVPIVETLQYLSLEQDIQGMLEDKEETLEQLLQMDPELNIAMSRYLSAQAAHWSLGAQSRQHLSVLEIISSVRGQFDLATNELLEAIIEKTEAAEPKV